MKITLYWIVLCISLTWSTICCSVEKGDTSASLGKVIFRIDPDLYGLTIDYDGESAHSGPTAFSVLGDSLALLRNDQREILVISSNGAVARRIKFAHAIDHFDMDRDGNGFVQIWDSLYELRNFVPARSALKVPFMEGVQGQFKIDLIKEDKVRFLSLSPQFIIEVRRDEVSKAIPKPLSWTDSVITRDISLYVGLFKNYHVFLDYNAIGPNKLPYFKVFAFNAQDSSVTHSRTYSSPEQNLGCNIMWSYWIRMDKTKSLFYVMFYDRGHIVIRLFDLEQLLEL